MSPKAFAGRSFEDFSIGQRFVHASPRTLHGGDLALYMALTGDRRPLTSSTVFARSLGYQREVAPCLLGFHIVFGKSVPDISQNAIANLGYADVRFIRPVYPGDTLTADTEVIGLRESSAGDTGVVYVATRGVNQKGQDVLSFVRWVLVPKRDPKKATGHDRVPKLPDAVPVDRLPANEALNLQRFLDLQWATGGRALWDDYEIGEKIVHGGAMTIEDADHVQATRLYHNTARVHFDGHGMTSSRFGKRVVYGGHVISVAHSLAYDGLENVLGMAAWNSGVHVNPTFGGDTIAAWTEVVDRAEVPNRRDIGALRMKLYAVKNVDLRVDQVTAETVDGEGKRGFDPRVVLALDWWGLIPRRPS
jgi:2-methylfumaryl-CoA hydratase